MSLTATTLAYAVDNYASTIQVTSATGFVVGNPVRVDHELMKVQTIDGTSIGVMRGIRGSKCQAHNALANTVTGPWVDFPVERFPTPGSYSYDASGAISIAPGIHKIVKASAATMTLAPPSRAEEGIVMSILALTTAAHTVTVSVADDAVAGFGGKGTGGDAAALNATGDTLTLIAARGRWYILGLNSVTLS